MQQKTQRALRWIAVPFAAILAILPGLLIAFVIAYFNGGTNTFWGLMTAAFALGAWVVAFPAWIAPSYNHVVAVLLAVYWAGAFTLELAGGAVPEKLVMIEVANIAGSISAAAWFYYKWRNAKP
jgi:hypothetical protein